MLGTFPDPVVFSLRPQEDPQLLCSFQYLYRRQFRHGPRATAEGGEDQAGWGSSGPWKEGRCEVLLSHAQLAFIDSLGDPSLHVFW